MTLKLYFHPFSSYCQKAVIALYENGTPFQPEIIDLSDATSRGRLTDLWPMGKFPVLRDEARDRTIPESSVIIEYLAHYYPGAVPLVPSDPDLAWQARMRDRFYDCYVDDPAAKVVVDTFRPPGQNDTVGVEQAKAQLRTAYGIIEHDMATKTWAVGDAFSMADCSAAPALFYANLIVPLADGYPRAAAYLNRLLTRPAFRRAVQEAVPYVAGGFPFADKYAATYREFFPK